MKSCARNGGNCMCRLQLSVKVRAGTAAMAKSCYRLGTKVLFTGDSGATKVSDEQFWGGLFGRSATR